MDTVIIILVIFIIVCVLIGAITLYISQKRLKNVVSELKLEQGGLYNVTTNNGNRYLNLTYNRISYGKRSQNGNINIYFIKNSKYRGTITQKEVMIKYGNIWKIYRLDAPSNDTEYTEDETSY